MKKTLLLLSLATSLASTAQQSFSFQHGGLNRNYLLYVPAEPSAEPLPVVFVLHGFTQTAQGIMTYSGFNEIAEREGFIAVYPNGVNLAWNVGFGGGSSADDVGFLSALIDTLAQHYPVDLARVYSCGMSNGGFMSHRLACELSDRIAAIAGVTGTMSSATFDDCSPERPVPVLQIHGTADLIVNYNGAVGIKSVDETLAFWRAHNDCPPTALFEALPDIVNEGSTVERYTYGPCEEESEVMLLKVLNGGHTWPGSNGLSGLGNTNRDISASEEIWDFFSRHRLGGPASASQARPLPFARPPFPNPFSEHIALEAGPAGIQQLSLFSNTGTLLRQSRSPIQEGAASFETYGLPPGLYILQAVSADGQAQHWKVIKY
jgi:polyhydroxybutyrate depolymerase